MSQTLLITKNIDAIYSRRNNFAQGIDIIPMRVSEVLKILDLSHIRKIIQLMLITGVFNYFDCYKQSQITIWQIPKT